MNEALLMQIGLNQTQAKAYLTLVRHGSLTPPELAKKTGETRTNAYTVLDRLVELGLAKKDDSKKKLAYRVGHPVALENLVKKHRDEALQREKLVKDSMPALLNFFYTYSEQPGVRFYQGKDGIKEIYNDTLRTGQEIFLLRSPHDNDLMSKDYLLSYKERRAKLGLSTNTLSPDVPSATHDAEDDKQHNIKRTWLPKGAYTAPVEIDVYGDKVALISFGEEAMGTIIESPQVAEAMRQLFGLVRDGLSR